MEEILDAFPVSCAFTVDPEISAWRSPETNERAKYTRTRENLRTRDARGAPKISLDASLASPVRVSRARAVCLLVCLWQKLRGCPCKNRPLDFRPKTEFLQIFRLRKLVHVINKKGNNLAFNAIFQYFWRQFQRTVQNR